MNRAKMDTFAVLGVFARQKSLRAGLGSEHGRLEWHRCGSLCE